MSKYKISRRGRKLQVSDDPRIVGVLPKDIAERTWFEIMLKEETDLIAFDLREEILEDALRIVYERYMQRQTTSFTAYCAAEAWLKLIDWHFYRHDPGEDPSAYPPCFIPKRVESWVPDDLPEPSPKDPWCRQALNVVEVLQDEVGVSDAVLKRWPSNSSIDLPVIDEISSECWFPGKVRLLDESEVRDKSSVVTASHVIHFLLRAELGSPRKGPQVPGDGNVSGDWDVREDSEITESEDLAAESELLQHVTDYTTEELSKKDSEYSALKTTTPVDKSLLGVGEFSAGTKFKRKAEKMKSFSRASMAGRSRGAFLPPLDRDSHSKNSIISDCRLKNLRLDTQYEISSEKFSTPSGESDKRK